MCLGLTRQTLIEVKAETTRHSSDVAMEMKAEPGADAADMQADGGGDEDRQASAGNGP